MSVVILATLIIPVNGAPITPQDWSSPTYQTGQKDLDLEFVDTLELIPDSWSSYEEEF